MTPLTCETINFTNKLLSIKRCDDKTATTDADPSIDATVIKNWVDNLGEQDKLKFTTGAGGNENLAQIIIQLLKTEKREKVDLYVETAEMDVEELQQALCDTCCLLDLDKNPKLQQLDHDHLTQRVQLWQDKL